MTQVELARRFDTVVRQYDLLRHPLYQAWAVGSLTKDNLREYSVEYYHQVAAVPVYLRHFGRRLPTGELRHEVFQVLCDVEGKNGDERRAHAVTWRVVAGELGADMAAINDHKPLATTEQMIQIFLYFARSGSESEVLAAFYAYQSQVSRVVALKVAALRNHYGMGENAVEYLVSQNAVNIRHANLWRWQLLKVLANDPSAVVYALIAAELAAKALWRALDGIHARQMSRIDQQTGSGSPP